MRLSKPVRLLVILMLAIGLFWLARLPSATRRSLASSAPQVVAWVAVPNVNWNS